MNRGQFLKLIRHPGSVNKQSLKEIDRLLNRYPYFQGGRVLAALGKHRTRQLDARKNIHLASLYTTDKQLFKELMSQKSSVIKSSSSSRVGSSPTSSGAKRRSNTTSGSTKKPNYVVPTLSEQERNQLVGSIMHELDNLKHNMSNFTYAEQSRELKVEETRKRNFEEQQTKAQLEAERQKLTEEQKRLEAQKAASEQQTKAQLEAERQKLASEQQTKAQFEAERQKLASEQQIKAHLEAERQKLASEQQIKAQLEAERQKLVSEQQIKAQLEAERQQLASEQQIKAQLEAERQRLAEEQKRLEAQKAAEVNQRFEEKVRFLEARFEAERQKLAEEQKRLEAQKVAEINQRIEEKIRTLETRTQEQKMTSPSPALHPSYVPTPHTDLRYTPAQANVPPPYSYNSYSSSLPAPYPINYPYVTPMQAYPFSSYFQPQFSMPTASHMPTYGPPSSPLQFPFVPPAQSASIMPTTTPMPFTPAFPSQEMMLPATTPLPTPEPQRPDSRDQRVAIDHFIDSLSKDKSKSISFSASSSDTINDEICSEELAQLYHNQGHIERAIEIYHRLCDKYPEKSQHFLQKIKAMKKI